jgi:hypothetical protein
LEGCLDRRFPDFLRSIPSIVRAKVQVLKRKNVRLACHQPPSWDSVLVLRTAVAVFEHESHETKENESIYSNTRRALLASRTARKNSNCCCYTTIYFRCLIANFLVGALHPIRIGIRTAIVCGAGGAIPGGEPHWSESRAKRQHYNPESFWGGVENGENCTSMSYTIPHSFQNSSNTTSRPPTQK